MVKVWVVCKDAMLFSVADWPDLNDLRNHWRLLLLKILGGIVPARACGCAYSGVHGRIQAFFNQMMGCEVRKPSNKVQGQSPDSILGTCSPEAETKCYITVQMCKFER